MPTLGNLFTAAVDGVFAVDARQRIIYWDPGCEDLFDKCVDWALGRPCCDVLRGVNPSTGAPVCAQNCCVAGLGSGADAPKSFPLHVHCQTGHTFSVHVNIVLVPSDCKKSWVTMHLLSRNASGGVLNAVDATLRPMGGNGARSGTPAPAGQSLPRGARLSAREREVLQLLAEGLPCTLISQRLSISLTTVRNHVQHVQAKLGVHSQTGAVAYAYRHNLVQ